MGTLPIKGLQSHGEMTEGQQPGTVSTQKKQLSKMHYSGLQLLGFLCMWIPAFHCRPVVDQLWTDAKTLAKTIMVRLENHPSYNLLPESLKVKGLDFIPEGHPLNSFDSVDEVLEIFQTIFSHMTINDMDQILVDMENLRELFKTIHSVLQCPAQKTRHHESLDNLPEQYAKSPLTVVKVALDRFNKNLSNIVQYLEHSRRC